MIVILFNVFTDNKGELNLKKILSLLLCLTVLTLFSGCANDKETTSNNTENTNELKIVTSFYPIYIETINITKGIDGVVVENMTKPQTGCLHDYQMTPADMKKLENANIFIANGAGMESFLEDIINNQKQLHVIDSSANIPLLIDEHGENPHVWVSISNCITQVETITEELSKIDPNHADQYHKNAEDYIARLKDLQNEMHATIDPLPNKKIVTFHEAFPYFAEEFNLDIVGVIEREPGTAPTPTELTDIISQVKNLPTKALFAEPQYSSTAAEAIANETGAKIYTLDPVVTGKDDPDAYIKAMQENAKTLQEALK